MYHFIHTKIQIFPAPIIMNTTEKASISAYDYKNKKFTTFSIKTQEVRSYTIIITNFFKQLGKNLYYTNPSKWFTKNCIHNVKQR